MVITVQPGDPPLLWLERQPVTLSQLADKLDERRGSENSPSATVLLLVDRKVPVEAQQKVAEMALLKGYQVFLLGTPANDDPPPSKND